MPKDMEYYVAEVVTSFKRGTTEMLLLSLLTTGDRYAYELSKALKEKSKGLFDIQGPSLYTALYRLQEREYVSTREERAGRRIRVYYHILPAGEEYLRRISEEYRAVSAGIAAVLSAAENTEKGEA